ncbi:hypothetical protein GCM10022243_68010 [Saccharothrix violaceirubra]|uniref:LytR/CpsA/Psr regulator C-terminal domain-containing protein n=1 Tax=Saccharothrix violaceirubra TaxID=413306 RepID=A0A7W7WZH0_9PSEU|nr:LytR C-terminal domain-containing protein [Saccharothrix violaceirubra]MBB4968793.1 hypothetical protein [Saccharothrix violaceirubra]
MTNPEPTGSAHPARAAGIVLLGVAAVALVIGVASLFVDSDDSTVAGQSRAASTAESTSSATTAAPPVTTAVPAPRTTTSAVPSSAPPAATSAAPTSAAPTTSGQASAKPLVRVYNNSTIVGLGARAAEDVKRAGWEVADTANYSQGQIPTTTVYFRPGTDEEASARQLAEVLHARAEPRFEGIVGAHAGIIVIVTNDYKGTTGAKK